MSGALAVANPRRIKASHRRRRKIAVGLFVQRYYDPTLGRFLSVDPVTANSNTGGNFNRYWYANNNPYKFTDPDGRLSLPRELPRACSFESGQCVGGGVGLQAGSRGQPASDKGKSAGKRDPTKTGTLLKGAQDGHLTRPEAKAWYQHGNGKPLTVDQSKLSVNYRINADGSYKAWVTGADWAVHGSVSLNFKTMRIYDAPYDFESHPGEHGRNAATFIGRLYNGNGTPYMINYRGGNPAVRQIEAADPVLPKFSAH